MSFEILAPVGGEEMLTAAVFSGANAIYLGLTSLNARRTAQGFTSESLVRTVCFCRARGVKVYVALNTTVYKQELGECAKAIADIANAGADAIIVQDLATASLIKQIVPTMPIHGSTQMSVHTLMGAKQLEKMGFSRVILSRELSLSEIENITKNCKIETEVFVHGALCMSVSGQCYMSAFLGGRSGNRGSCAGPCRLPFSASDEGLCHLSLKDMSHIDYLPQLAKIGVVSAKIEGRLRTPEYVAASVNSCILSLNKEEYDKQLLQNVFSRSGFTDGYIAGKRNGEMFGIRTPNDTSAAREAQPKLRELYRRERQSVGVDFKLTLTKNALKLIATDGENVAQAGAEITIEEAKNDSTPAINKALSKCGGTPFFARDIKIDGIDGIYVPASAINELRRTVIEELEKMRVTVKCHEINNISLPPLLTEKRSISGYMARFESVNQLFDGLSCFDKIILPIDEMSQIPEEIVSKTWLELPRVSFTLSQETLQQLIENAEKMGFAGFIAENIGHIFLLQNKNFMCGFGLNITNPLAFEEYKKLGAKGAVISFETQAIDMPSFGAQTAVIAYGHMPLMITRACPLHNVQTCAQCNKKGQLLDRKGVYLQLLCKGDVRTIYNPIPLYMGDKLQEFSADYALLYFTIESAKDAEKATNIFLQKREYKKEFTRGLYFKGTT